MATAIPISSSGPRARGCKVRQSRQRRSRHARRTAGPQYQRWSESLRCNADGVGAWAVAEPAVCGPGRRTPPCPPDWANRGSPVLRPGSPSAHRGFVCAGPTALAGGTGPPRRSGPDRRQAAPVLHRNRMPGSCPILFAWNGRRFVFVNDFLGAGSIGETGPDGTTRPPRRKNRSRSSPNSW